MNILIPHTWLLEHLETTALPQDIQRLLSLSGPSIERIYEREGESVYDIEVTTNRVDMMSVRGIAREAAVILTQANQPSTLKPISSQVPRTLTAISKAASANTHQLPLPKISNNPELCGRVLCVVLSLKERSTTPDWMAKRLTQIDQQTHDAAIDITNYITHELGHPCHAFDYDKIMALGGEIIVTTAKKNEQFTTLDGQQYTTTGGEVVFKNPAGEIIDLPGIKGTKNSSVDASTKNILLWIESVAAGKIRFASMTHAIRTVAAQLNEKNVDPHSADAVLAHGVQMYEELCGASVASAVYDDFPGKKSPQAVTVSLARISDYLGISLPVETIIAILETLGCTVATNENKQSIAITPPTFRPDITIPADVIEEVARIYGYHNLPSTLMDTPIPTNRPTETNFQLETRVKRFLAALGWQEVYTYSMVSEAIAEESGFAASEHLKLANPLTDDRMYLRRSLLPSLSEVITNNPQAPTLSVFEVANTYTPSAVTDELPRQTLQLALVTPQSYRKLRGVVETLLDQWYITAPVLQETSTDQTPFSQRALLAVSKQAHDASLVSQIEIGTIGVLNNGLHAAVLDVATLVQLAESHPTYQPIPKTSPIIEDYTFTLPAMSKLGEVIASIQRVNPLITSVELLDQYQQNVSFRITYWDVAESLSTERVEPIRLAVITAVSEQHQGALVGSVA
jgi:phenylalanyl-tRNA synthetase beta chain